MKLSPLLLQKSSCVARAARTLVRPLSFNRSEIRIPVLPVSFPSDNSLVHYLRRPFSWRLLSCLLFFVIASSLFISPAVAEPPSGVELTPDMLWEQAVAARDAGKNMTAAILFQRLQNRYPNAVQAEDALWQAAQQAKKYTLTAKDPNWRYVRDLFKRYTVDYPDSSRYPEAYYEGAVAHYNMQMFREALIYFNLFLKRFPNSPLVPEALYWQGQTFLSIGRLEEATNVFKKLSNAKDQTLRLRGYVGLGDALFAGKKYLAALDVYKKVKAMGVGYHYQDPSFLVKLGKTYFKVGNEDQGRKQLFHYLNLDKTTRYRADVVFEIAESYHRYGDEDAAQRMYAMAVSEGASDSRPVILSLFRMAVYRDDPERVVPDWKKPVDLADPAGDKPYMDVLDLYQREPIAQEARLALIRRYKARKDNDRLFEVAANYVRYAPEGPLRQEMEIMVGNLLEERVQNYLAEQRYQDVFDLYRAEYSHVTGYKQGRLLYLIGQALEAMTLYDQASVVYYRALGLPLSDADKADLYLRRARVYIANKDWSAADRLLTHLRKIYKDDKVSVQYLCMSGRFAESQGKESEALVFYYDAFEVAGSFNVKPSCAPDGLVLLAGQGRNDEAQAMLARFARDKWLVPEVTQEWHERLGDNFLKAGDKFAAVKSFREGLSEGMPQAGEVVQSIQIRLGSVLASQGKVDEARSLFEAARAGSGEMWRKVAEERLNQLSIDGSMMAVDAVLKQ